MENFKNNMYRKGMEAYKKRRYDEARSIFNRLLSYEEYFYKAMRMIIKLNIRQYRYREARGLISNHMYLDNFNTLIMLSSIEGIEYNYSKSILLYKKVMEMAQVKASVSSMLVDAYINNGEFDEARELLNLISKGSNFRIVDKLRIIMIDIILENFDKAFQELIKLDPNNLGDSSTEVLYWKSYLLIMYFLGKEPKVSTDNRSVKSVANKYKTILFGERDRLDELRASIISNQITKEDHLYFSPELDPSQFIGVVQEQIATMNPRYVNMVQMYSVKLGFPTGKLNGKDVYGAMVSTPIGSDRIISIIPADFSDEYDKEHLSTDAELRKRLIIG